MAQDEVDAHPAHVTRSSADGLGRRNFLRGASLLGTVGAVGVQLPGAGEAAAQTLDTGVLPVLQPGVGRIRGASLRSTPATVQWGYRPNRFSRPVLRIPSGGLVTIDTLSHEGLLED